MLKSFLVLSVFAASVGTGFAAAKKPKAHSAWMQAKIQDLTEKYKDSDKAISIAKYKFAGQNYYLMPPAAPCCDMPTELVDETGKHFCQLGGGFANHTDAQCADFKEKGQLLETIWSSSPKK